MAGEKIGNQRDVVLLTGGSGFIGRNIRESFLAEKYIIEAPGSRQLNLVDEDAVAKYFDDHRVDYVIHSACKPGHRFAKDSTGIFYTNTRMFFNLARHADRYKKMLVIGSGAIYDMRYYRPKVTEDQIGRTMPADEHGFSKYVCEKFLEKSDKIIDLVVFGIYGKYEEYAIRFPSNAICKVLWDLPITCRQDRLFDYLYIDDLMPILDYFITHETRHKSYNITPDTTVRLCEIADTVRKIAGRPGHPIQVAAPGLGLEYSGANTRLREEFSHVAFTPLQTGLTELYRWYAAHKDQINIEYLLRDP